ncbi:MAG: terminase small subunit [Lachnospiraceae bacterium]|nr:terminase small subunit [Lachnospiraceae bacterium]
MQDTREPSVKEREKQIAIAYCGEAHGNAEKACIMAGYSARYARGNAYKVVARENVQKYIEYINSLVINKEYIASVEDIQKFWTKIMEDESQKATARLRASENLAKVKGMYKIEEEW